MPPSSPSTGTPASPTARVSWGGGAGQLPPPNEYMQTVYLGLQEMLDVCVGIQAEGGLFLASTPSFQYYNHTPARFLFDEKGEGRKHSF